VIHYYHYRSIRTSVGSTMDAIVVIISALFEPFEFDDECNYYIIISLTNKSPRSSGDWQYSSIIFIDGSIIDRSNTTDIGWSSAKDNLGQFKWLSNNQIGSIWDHYWTIKYNQSDSSTAPFEKLNSFKVVPSYYDASTATSVRTSVRTSRWENYFIGESIIIIII